MKNKKEMCKTKYLEKSDFLDMLYRPHYTSHISIVTSIVLFSLMPTNVRLYLGWLPPVITTITKSIEIIRRNHSKQNTTFASIAAIDGYFFSD